MDTKPITWGIDPGRDGALVILQGDRVLAARRATEITAGLKWSAGADLVAAHVRGLLADFPPDLAVLELYAGRPGEGGGSAMTTGVGWGTWRGILAALDVRTITPASSSWTRALLKDVQAEGKDRAIAVATSCLPSLDLTPGRCKKPHSGLADAACLALYGAAHPLARR